MMRSLRCLIVLSLAPSAASILSVLAGCSEKPGNVNLSLIDTASAQAPSFLDVVVSPIPPADEQEDPSFPGGNPINFFDAYSWRLFIALNWPAIAGKRGVADATNDISDTAAPRVWETWKSASELFQPGGKEPSEWDSFAAAPVCPGDTNSSSPEAKTMAFAMVGPVFEDLNQVGDTGLPVGSLVARNRTYVRFEIRMNQNQFDFIRNNRLYLNDVLTNRQNDGTANVFPDQSIEIKAAWREFKLPEEEGLLSRYYHVNARAFNPETKTCETKTFGLIGFHIAQKTKNRRQWTWSTFEHVDNLSVDAGAPTGSLSTLMEAASDAEASPPDGGVSPQLPPKNDPAPTLVRRLTLNPQNSAIPPTQTMATNAKWRNDPRIKNTVWENYQLIMTQWPTQTNTDAGMGAPFPSRNVANITMETYPELQRSSCIQCHFQTAFSTDFAWFLSLRAFVAPKLEAIGPLGLAPSAPANTGLINKLKEAATKANALHEQ